jgi:hypothetical protein
MVRLLHRVRVDPLDRMVVDEHAPLAVDLSGSHPLDEIDRRRDRPEAVDRVIVEVRGIRRSSRVLEPRGDNLPLDVCLIEEFADGRHVCSCRWIL